MFLNVVWVGLGERERERERECMWKKERERDRGDPQPRPIGPVSPIYLAQPGVWHCRLSHSHGDNHE